MSHQYPLFQSKFCFYIVVCHPAVHCTRLWDVSHGYPSKPISICCIPIKLSADFYSVLVRGNLLLLLIAATTHRNEWHLYYSLVLFLRYGAVTERHFRDFDFPLYILILLFASGIVSLVDYEIAFLLTGYEAYNRVQILGFAGKFYP